MYLRIRSRRGDCDVGEFGIGHERVGDDSVRHNTQCFTSIAIRDRLDMMTLCPGQGANLSSPLTRFLHFESFQQSSLRLAVSLIPNFVRRLFVGQRMCGNAACPIISFSAPMLYRQKIRSLIKTSTPLASVLYYIVFSLLHSSTAYTLSLSIYQLFFC